ncbi:MAG: cadherin-like beta sandwich domain-containing protein [Chloroflexi bacterium]|nr:cadherin-like beta sandwich domain-containing protein [Chloroflexota bacterium]
MFWTNNSKKLGLIARLRANLRVSLAAAAVTLAVIGILAWTSSGAQAASTQKLIGNVDQAEDGVIYLNHGSHGFGQEFATGSARGGYLLDHIKPPIKKSRDGRWVKITGTIRRVNEDGGPGEIVHTVEDADAYYNHNDFTFVSRETQVLMPNTRYMFVITCDSGCEGDNFLKFTKTSADGKDADSRDDWSLAERAVHDWYDWLPTDDYPYSLMFDLQGRLANAAYIADDGVQIISEPIASSDGYGDGPTEIVITTTRPDHPSRNYAVRVAQNLVPDITEIRLTSDPGADGTYATGDVINVAATFNAPVAVDTTNGVPYVGISVGDNLRNASYTSIDATGKVLTFSYTVVEDDSDQDGISIAADALTLDGGSITAQVGGADAVLDHSALTSQAGHIVNKVPKIVTGGVMITSTPLAASDTYGKGETIAFTVTFDSNVVVDTTDGIPTLSMDFWHRGGNLEIKELTFVRGSGGRSLEFEYVVRPADRDNSGLVVKQNQLRLTGGSIQHATTGRDAVLDHPRPVYGGDHKVDGRLTPPRAQLSSLSLTNATLSPAFDPATAEYTAMVAPGVTETTATATVQAGYTASIEPADADSSASGHQVAVSDGAAITITVAATGKLPIEYTVTIMVGTMVDSVAVTSAPGADGTYATGDVISVAVTFNAPVTVDTTDGTPYVAVSVGDNLRNAAYASIDATGKVLTFSYTVVEDDSDQDGISIAADALTLDGGSITAQVGGADAGLDHDALASQAGHIVNKVPSIVANGVAVISSPLATADTYGEGETITFTVTFESKVVVDTTDGIPTLEMDLWHPGATLETKELSYVGGSGSSTLEFQYVVQAGDRDNTGIAVEGNRLRLNGGSIKHETTGRDANLNHAKPERIGHKVDSRLDPPRAELNTLSLTDVTLSPAFDPATTEYTAVVAPGVTETTATATVQAGYTASIEPPDADSGASGHQVAVSDGAVITITASGTAKISTEYTVTLEMGMVMVQSVAVSSDPGDDGTYATGDVISVALTVNQPVTVDTTDGTPYVAVSVGDNSRNATYASIDATDKVLTFSYTVVEDDSDQDGISIAANALSLDGGSITGQASGADAVLDHDALTSQAGHIVNKVPSIVANGVAVISSPLAAADTYGEGETIAFTVTFDSSVVVDTTDGIPTLSMEFWHPGRNREIKELGFVRGSGSTTLEFEYVVQQGDRDNSGLVVKQNQLRLNGGSIQHATTGRDAVLDHPRPVYGGDHKVDGRLTPPRAQLSSLSLSDATLSPAFAPATTEYTAEVGPAVTQTTVTATVLVGHIGSIEPADSDGNTAGHQVSLATESATIEIQVMRAGRLTVTYTVAVSRTMEPPSKPTNLTATSGDETATLAWVTPPAFPAVSGHEYRYKSSSDADYPEAWTAIADSAVGEDNEDGFTVESLANGVAHFFQVRAVNSEGASEPSDEAAVLVGEGLGICDRTRTVQVAILEELAEIQALTEIQDCSDVTSADLSTILDLYVQTVESELKVDDFTGLTAMTALDLTSPYRLTSLPSRILAGLPELTRLTIEGVDGELPEDIFAPVPTLTSLYLVANRFTALPEDLFSGLSSLSHLELGANGLTDLPENVFDGLTSLTSLWLEINELTELPGGVFDGLSALTRLHLDRNQLTSLPVGVIDDLTALESLTLHQNQLNELPDGMFANLSSPLTQLNLRNNATNPILLPVGLESVGTLQFRAVAPKGAPFNMWLPLTVTDGSISSGATGVTILAGEVASAIVTVEPASEASNPTVAITKVPGTPNEHDGYRLSLSSPTPLQLEDHRPRIESIALGSDPVSDDTYVAGDAIEVLVTFDRAVQVDTTLGTPHVALTIGTATRNAEYVSADAAGKALTFSYTVVLDDDDSNGVSIAADALALNGGSITNRTTGDDALLTHQALADQSGHLVHNSQERATLTALSMAGITLTPAFTSDVVDYTATVGRDTTETTVSVAAEAGATASILPADADTATDGHQVSLSRGANEITITVRKRGLRTQTYTVTIDRIWAEVTSVAFTSDAGADNIYVTDDVIEVSVTFGAPVVVDTTDGTPYIEVLIGNFYKQATYSGIDSSNRILTFTYTVTAADNDQGGIEIDANSLTLDGGTIKPQGTDFDADLAHDAVDQDPKHLVNEIPLLIGFGAVSLVSNPRATQYTYGRSEAITFRFAYSTKVTVDTTGGIPHLLVSVGNSDNTPRNRQFNYARGSGTRTLEFEYLVQADDRDSNGIELGEGRLRLNGGAIRHASTGQAASLSYQVPGSITTFGAHKVDGSLENQTIRACEAEVIDRKARLDICWDLGRAVPTDADVVIEASSRYLWEWTVDFDLPVQEPAPVWKAIARGDDYVACGEMDTSCIKFSDADIFRGAPLTYDLRIRRGDTVLARSPRLRTQAPNWDDSSLNAELYSVLLPDKLESYPDQVATGPFRTDLELTDPEVSGVMVEAVKDLELSDFEVTNGVATAIQVSSGGVYVITVEPTTLGQSVTISLPANRVTGVGQGLTADGENNYTRGNTASNTFTVETREP